jgi:hypothetical protein
MSRIFTITSAIVVAIVAELIVLGIAKSVANDKAMFWQYAARYSARASFLIFVSLLLYTAMYGLSTINNDSGKRKVLGMLIYLFWTNHIIHLIFLSVIRLSKIKYLSSRETF